MLSWKVLGSHFKCDTEVGGEGFERGAVVEAFSWRCVEVPDYVIDVVITVAFEAGLAGKVATEAAVGPKAHPEAVGEIRTGS